MRRARAITVGTSLVLLGAFVVTASVGDEEAPLRDGDDPVVERWSLPETPFLWPENWARPEDRARLRDVQSAVDAGEPDERWRLDPEQVVERFLSAVLAWDEPTVEETDAPSEDRVFLATPRCDGDAAGCERGSLVVTVGQPGRSGGDGVWSVVSATNEALQVHPATTGIPSLAAGSLVDIQVRLPGGRSAHAGIVVSNACREASGFALDVTDTSTLEVPPVGTDDPPCGSTGAGYAFVYAMDDTAVPTGDPLLEAATIRYPWLTIVPVKVLLDQSSRDA